MSFPASHVATEKIEQETISQQLDEYSFTHINYQRGDKNNFRIIFSLSVLYGLFAIVYLRFYTSNEVVFALFFASGMLILSFILIANFIRAQKSSKLAIKANAINNLLKTDARSCEFELERFQWVQPREGTREAELAVVKVFVPGSEHRDNYLTLPEGQVFQHCSTHHDVVFLPTLTLEVYDENFVMTQRVLESLGNVAVVCGDYEGMRRWTGAPLHHRPAYPDIPWVY